MVRCTRQLGSLPCLFLLMASAGLAATPSSSHPSTKLIHLPQGIADSQGRIGYFASAAGGIEALDLASGKVLWQTMEAQRPLLIDGDHLVAQAGVKRNRLRILCLDLKRDGECDLESDPVVFPAWVVTGDAPGRLFSAKWRLERHRLILDWEASAWYVGAAKPTPEQVEAARKHADGQVFVDLRTGQTDAQPAKKNESPSAPTLPEPLQQRSLRWQGPVGKSWKVLSLEDDKGKQRFMLHTWMPGEEAIRDSKELMTGVHLQARASLDESVLFLRESNLSPDQLASLMPKKPQPPWHLFSVSTGEHLGSIPHEAGMYAFAVLGKRALYLVPGSLSGSLQRGGMQTQTLRAVDITTGKKIWDHPVAAKVIAPPPL
jgi:hypothetical protein